MVCAMCLGLAGNPAVRASAVQESLQLLLQPQIVTAAPKWTEPC